MNAPVTSVYSMPRYRIFHLVLVCFLYILPTSAQAGGINTAVIDLNNRSAQELIPLIKPHLPGLSLSGRGFQLIARGSQSDLQNLKVMLEQLDRTVKRLRITVDFTGGKYSSNQSTSASGKISNRDSHVTVKSYGTRNRDDGAQVQNILTLDGQSAFISSGVSVPVGRSLNYQNGHSSNRDSQIQYRDVVTGIHVLPQLRGNQVTLYVSTVRGGQSKQRYKVFNRQVAETVVRGRTGEWILIGGVSQTGTSDGSGTTYSTRTRGQQFGNIRIRVTQE
ncbi:MAG TPA: hypothetical protein ENI64_08635 [Gammaproteobacteria bacterium]|nr:hypothetical protein [Gammaproteobacteria bacterium]